MTHTAAQPTPDLPAALIGRCVDLGLAAWRFDGRAALLCGPHGPEAALPWLRVRALGTMVESRVRSWASRTELQPAELFPGAWLLPVVDTGPATPEWLLAVLMLQPASVEADALAGLCAAADLDVASVGPMLAPLVAGGWPEPGRLAIVLEHARDDLQRASADAGVISEFSDQLVQSYEETNLLYRLGRLLKSSTAASQTIETTCVQIREILAFEWVAVLFRSSGVLPQLADRLILVGDIPCPRDAFRAKASELSLDWTGDDWTRVLEPGQSELAAMTGAEMVAEPITHDGRIVGALLAGNKAGRDPDVSSVDTQFLDATADFLGVFHENAARFEDQRVLFFGTLQALTASIDAKDRYTCGHSERVSLMASMLATRMGLGEREIEEVRIAGLVHDVGKIGVPESVLTKPGRLTRDEFEQMKRHPVIGHDILSGIPQLAPMLPGVLHHHERWDGTGYPAGLAGEVIPLYGRILACADAFDAMSSTRSYRAAMTREDVLAEYRRCAGMQFDPELTRLFVALDFGVYDEMVERQRASAALAA